jgi:hypothetical protein
MPAKKFSMESCAKRVEKRPLSEALAMGNKIPRAGDVVVDPLVPRTTIRSTRPLQGPVVVCIHKYTNNAGDLIAAHADKKVPLYQIQLDHNVARNSVTFKFKDRLRQFLIAARVNDETIPATLEGLAEQAGIHTVVAGGPDNLKGSVAVAYRCCLYVAGDEQSLMNALLLLDGYFVRELKDESPIHLHPHVSIDLKPVMEDCCGSPAFFSCALEHCCAHLRRPFVLSLGTRL